MEDKKAKILERVRGLLAKADSTEFEEEAQSLRQKADELMLVYAIEAFELDMTKPKHEREKPEVRQFNYSHPNKHVHEAMSRIFYELSRLCRCKMGFYGWSFSKVVGYPADLDYLDLLMTSVMVQFANKLDPKPSPSLSYEDNLYLLKTAGFKWQKCYELMLPYYPERFAAGLTDLAPDQVANNNWARQDNIILGDKVYLRKMPRNIGVRFTGEYKKHCENNNLDRVMSNPETYQRNFADGFMWTLVNRIYDMRQAQKSASTGSELVLANRDGDLEEKLYEEFPEKRPCPPGCTCSKHKPVRYAREVERKVDYAAKNAGSTAARNVDLSGGRGHLKAQREIK